MVGYKDHNQCTSQAKQYAFVSKRQQSHQQGKPGYKECSQYISADQ
jgi:hypothetical protein